MNHFLQSAIAPSPSFAMDGINLNESSFVMETNPQHFIPDDSLWHDPSCYISVSPQSVCNSQSDCALESPKGMIIKDKRRGSRRVRSKEQTTEVVLRRRAQNRASQRAYRERKDRRVTELETQLKEMGERNESLSQDYAGLTAAYEKLNGEHKRCSEGKEGLKNNEAELWKAVARLLFMLGEDAMKLVERGVLVKFMVCIRESGEGTNASHSY